MGTKKQHEMKPQQGSQTCLNIKGSEAENKGIWGLDICKLSKLYSQAVCAHKLNGIF